jgi:hypothetical protein
LLLDREQVFRREDSRPADRQVAWRSGARGDGITPAEAADRLVERRLAGAAP